VRISPARKRLKDEDGFMLIEVLMSALVLTIASAGVAAVLATSVSTAGEQRLGSQAYALAQQDQSRLVTMQLSNLNHLEQIREVPLNGTNFKVKSIGLWINNTTSTQLCKEGATADYVQISSVVTWPRMEASEKAKIVSIISPSGTQSVDPTHGTLTIVAANEKSEPVANLQLTGSQIEGTGHFEGQTDAAGCAVFPDLPTQNSSGEKRPNYTVEANGEYAGVINKDGLYKLSTQGSTETPTILSFRFDRPGTIPLQFKYRVGSSSEFKPAAADSLVAYNTGMTTAKTFWTASGLRETTVNAAPLFPFNSPYTIYAGSCSANNPNPEAKTNPPSAPAVASTTLAPAGGVAAPAVIQLPALNLTVTNKSVAVKGARVTVTDKTCTETKGNKVKRIYTTNKEGKMSATSEGEPEPGLPWGAYELCVSAEVKAGETKRFSVSTVTVQNLTTGTTQAVELASGETNKTCP
jgi:Tfp pilus assembly protein PilV